MPCACVDAEQKRESGISRILAKIGMSKEEAKCKPAPAAAAAAAKARAADTPQARAIESLRIKSKAVVCRNKCIVTVLLISLTCLYVCIK